jgi:hypothetical protein
MQIWLLVKGDCPSLSDREIWVLLPFVITYLYKTGFFAVAVMKRKYRLWLITEEELRVAISLISPRLELWAEKQAHPSHQDWDEQPAAHESLLDITE